MIFSQLAFSQDKNSEISIEFNNISRTAALQKIETISKYKIYYQDAWFENNVLISGNYVNKTISEIVSKILDDTDLNFFIDKNKIVLTKNSIIYDSFPDYETNNQSTANKPVKSANPVFFGQFDSVKKSGSKDNNNIVLVGKESNVANTGIYTLSGYLKDIKTGAPLADINVKVRNTAISTVTNAEGYYFLKVPTEVNIIDIESIIYQNITRKVMVYSDGKLDLFLNEKLNQLYEVVLNSKSSQNIRTAIT